MEFYTCLPLKVAIFLVALDVANGIILKGSGRLDAISDLGPGTRRLGSSWVLDSDKVEAS